MSNTIEEWQKELERLVAAQDKKNDDGFTTVEFMKMLDVGEKRARKLIKAGVLSGYLVSGKRKVNPDWDGRARIYPVYSIRKKGKNK